MKDVITVDLAYIVTGVLYIAVTVSLNISNFFLRKALRKNLEFAERTFDVYERQNKRLSDALRLAIDEIPAEKRTSELFDKFEKILCSDEVKL